MAKSEPIAAWLELIKGALEGVIPPIELVDRSAASLEEALGRRRPRSNAPPSGLHDAATSLIDCRFAEELLDPDDSAIPWNRASTLMNLQRYAEAGRDYLGAAVKLQQEADEGNGLTGDESDWVVDALLNACRAFLRAGQLLSAAVVARRLPEDVRLSVLDEIRRTIE